MAKPALLQRLERHFRNDPATLPVVEQHFAVYERPNLHLAIEELIRSMDAHFELTGIRRERSMSTFRRFQQPPMWHSVSDLRSRKLSI